MREGDLLSLPDHQRCDVAERRERATSIGGDDNVDASDGNKLLVLAADCHHDGAHQQCGRQVVSDRRDHEREHASDPEHLAQRVATIDQRRAQRFEDVAFLQRVDERHRHEQEQEQLAILKQAVLDRFVDQFFVLEVSVGDRGQDPDDPGGNQHWLALEQVDDGSDAERTARHVDARTFEEWSCCQ